MTANPEPWFDKQIVPAIQRRDKAYEKFKHSCLKTDQNNFKVTKMHLQKMILKKKKSYFEEELGKNRNKPKELWKTLSHSILARTKQGNQKFLLIKMMLFNLKHQKTQILSKGSTLNQPEASKKNCQGHPTNLLVKQPKTTTPRLHATYPMTLNFQTYLKKMLKNRLIGPNTSKISEGRC